jgi:hypothetical protein
LVHARSRGGDGRAAGARLPAQHSEAGGKDKHEIRAAAIRALQAAPVSAIIFPRLPFCPLPFPAASMPPPLPAPAEDLRARRLARAVIAAGVLVRLALAGTVSLSPEEAYHWNFGQHPAAGYLDHPPMMAWMSWLTTSLLGWNAWAVRLGPILLGGGAAWMVGAAARRLFSDRAALLAVIAWEAMPNSLLASITLLPDNPMIFGWCAALLGLTLACFGGRPAAGWLLAGAGLGFAVTGKYTAGLLAPSVFLFLLLSRDHRRQLLTPWPWLACVLAAAVFSPVLAWNAQHDWASFRFQFARRVSEFEGLSGRFVLKFLGHQLLAVSPFLAPVVAAAAARGARDAGRGDARALCLACVSFPTLLAFAYASIRGASHFIWTLPAYPGLAVLAGAWLEGAPAAPSRAKSILFRVGVAATAAGLLVGWVHAVWTLPGVRPLEEVRGWEALAGRVERERAALAGPEGEAFILGLGRRFTVESALAFFTRRPDLCHGKNLLGLDGLQYRYWVEPGGLRGRNAVAVLEGYKPGELRRGGDLERLRRWFASCDEPVEVRVDAGGGPFTGPVERSFFLVRARGYRGAPEKSERGERPDD